MKINILLNKMDIGTTFYLYKENHNKYVLTSKELRSDMKEFYTIGIWYNGGHLGNYDFYNKTNFCVDFKFGK